LQVLAARTLRSSLNDERILRALTTTEPVEIDSETYKILTSAVETVRPVLEKKDLNLFKKYELALKNLVPIEASN